ncbi:MAG TPA: hypothetical protein PLZ52_01055 [Bacteroidales bacterium]|nr:hypothetical protein [Bacteroidales bacterium]
MQNKHLILTFDYELFLGKQSGTVDNCLIIPTNHLLELFSKYSIQAIFFVDTVYLMRMEELANDYQLVKEDLQKIRNQLTLLVESGHYIFHHIHPHWLNAKYLHEINQWDLSDTSKLRFKDITDSEREMIFAYSNQFLVEIYSGANVNKTPCGYRAGGLFIEPLCDIIPYFNTYKIKYEFSVIPGDKREDNISIHDFSNAPKNRFYNFEDNLNEETPSGKFIEFPISTINIRYISKVFNGLYYRYYRNKINLKCYGDGFSVSAKISSSSKKKSIIDYVSMKIPASIEILNPTIIHIYKKHINKNSYFHFLSHPKLLTPESINQLESLLIYTTKKYSILFFED